MRKATEEQLQTGLTGAVCVESVPNQYATLEVDLDSTAVGHKWPSGATQDRRAAAEWIVRLLLSLVIMPSTVVDLDDPDAVRSYVQQFVVRGLAP